MYDLYRNIVLDYLFHEEQDCDRNASS